MSDTPSLTISVADAQTMISGLKDINNRLQKVHTVMESTSTSLDNFIDTQKELNNAMKPFVTIFSLREGTTNLR